MKEMCPNHIGKKIMIAAFSQHLHLSFCPAAWNTGVFGGALVAPLSREDGGPVFGMLG